MSDQNETRARPTDVDRRMEAIFGAYLYRARMERGWSAMEAGRRIGVSDKQVYRYERALNIPPLDVAVRLADALGVPLDEVAGRVQPADVPTFALHEVEGTGASGATIPPIRVEVALGRRRFVWKAEAMPTSDDQHARDARDAEESVPQTRAPVEDVIRLARGLGMSLDELVASGVDLDQGRTPAADKLREGGPRAVLEAAYPVLGWRSDEDAALAMGVEIARIAAWRQGGEPMTTGDVAKLTELIGLALRRQLGGRDKA